MVQKKFHKSSHTDTNLSNTSSSEEAIVREETAKFEEDIAASPTPSSSQKKDLTKEDVKAIKIQSFFRGYLVLFSTLIVFYLFINFLIDELACELTVLFGF